MSVRQGNKIIAGSAKAIGISIGTIFTAPYNNYTPEGAVLADGSEFDATQFPDLFNDYIKQRKVLTCNYMEFDESVSRYGSCARFAVKGNKFKVPLIGDGMFIAGGNADTNGVIFDESLPNITGDFDGGANELGINKVSGAFEGQNTTGQKGTSGSAINRSKYTGVTFDASRVSSAYQDGAKVQPTNIRMKHYVQVASGSVNQSMMDWSKYMQGLEGKANTNLSNTDNALSENFLSKITPDTNRIISITDTEPITSSPTFYTAPVAGVFYSSAVRNPAGYTLKIYVNEVLIYDLPAYGVAVFPINILLNKGDNLRAITDNKESTWTLKHNRFIPLKGAK